MNKYKKRPRGCEMTIKKNLKQSSAIDDKNAITKTGKPQKAINFVNRLLSIDNQKELEKQLSRLTREQLEIYKRKLNLIYPSRWQIVKNNIKRLIRELKEG